MSSAQALRIDGIAVGASGAMFGTVAAAGDVNGDGYDDMLLGAPHASVNGVTDAGAAYVLLGRDFTNSGVIEGDTGNNTLLAVTAGQHMVGGAGNDSLTGLGGAAVLNGGAGNDTLDGGGGTAILAGGAGDDLLKFHGGELRVDGGSGVDTLSFTGGGINLDLTTLPTSRVAHVERIDLTGDGGAGNALTLNIHDVFVLPDQPGLWDVSDPLSVQLRIDGGVGDAVHAPDKGWHAVTGLDIGNVHYDSYAATDLPDVVPVRLFIAQGVSFDGV